MYGVSDLTFKLHCTTPYIRIGPAVQHRTMYGGVQGRASDPPAHSQFLGILWVAQGCVPLYMEKHTAGKGPFYIDRWDFLCTMGICKC